MDNDVDTWRKASYSGTSGGNCVEVGSADVVMIRDTTNRDAFTLTVDRAAWSEFLSRIS